MPSRAYRDVPPDPTAPFFLVAFSHGLGGIRQQNMTMAERLASFGYVVVAPDRPGTTTLEFLSNVGDFSEALRVRPQTLRDAVDAVYAGVVPGVVPREGYGVVGHSLGALTTPPPTSVPSRSPPILRSSVAAPKTDSATPIRSAS